MDDKNNNDTNDSSINKSSASVAGSEAHVSDPSGESNSPGSFLFEDLADKVKNMKDGASKAVDIGTKVAHDFIWGPDELKIDFGENECNLKNSASSCDDAGEEKQKEPSLVEEQGNSVVSDTSRKVTTISTSSTSQINVSCLTAVDTSITGTIGIVNSEESLMSDFDNSDDNKSVDVNNHHIKLNEGLSTISDEKEDDCRIEESDDNCSEASLSDDDQRLLNEINVSNSPCFTVSSEGHPQGKEGQCSQMGTIKEKGAKMLELVQSWAALEHLIFAASAVATISFFELSVLTIKHGDDENLSNLKLMHATALFTSSAFLVYHFRDDIARCVNRITNYFNKSPSSCVESVGVSALSPASQENEPSK